VQLEQAEGIVVECSCGRFDCRTGCDHGKRAVFRSISTGRISRVGFGPCRTVVGCGFWCHVHRPAGDDHGRRHGEPVDDDD
jgi:hypothetical protein